MSKVLDNITEIVSEQVDLYKAKSKKSKLTIEEVDILRSLTDIQLKTLESNRKSPKKRPYTSGARLSDDDLLKYAKED